MGWLTTNTTVALTMAYTYYPVLKHGSRSASELRVFWCENQSMRNESKWIPMAAEAMPYLPVRIFLKDLSEINSDTTRKMMIFT
jgi:hypothetical protein